MATWSLLALGGGSPKPRHGIFKDMIFRTWEFLTVWVSTCFVITTNLEIYGTNSALWASIGVILSSHNRAVSLCNYKMVHFIIQLQYLNRTVSLPETQWPKNCMWLVFAIHGPTFVCTHHTPWLAQSLPTWYSWTPCKSIHHS